MQEENFKISHASIGVSNHGATLRWLYIRGEVIGSTLEIGQPLPELCVSKI